MDRKNYLQSSEWKKKRFERIKKDDGCCVLCGRKNGLVVHHLTYEHYGNENIDELITLCRSCHYRLHNPHELEPHNKKQPLYVKVDNMHWYGNGEILPVGDPVGVEYILATAEHLSDKKYHYITLDLICNILDAISGEKGKVFSYILRNMGQENILREAVKEIADGTQCEINVVQDTIDFLIESGYIVETESGIMVNPKLIHKGDSTEELKIFEKYQSSYDT